MPLRMVQVVLPSCHRDKVDEVFEGIEPDRRWWVELGDDLQMTSVLVRAEVVEQFADQISERFEDEERFRLVLVPAEATRPQLPEPEEEAKECEEGDDGGSGDGPSDGSTNAITTKPPRTFLLPRVAREELYEDIAVNAKPNLLFVLMTLLATVIAAVGLLRNAPAIIIGAMVIAPLLGPNMALALGTTLGDLKLIRRSLWCNLIGGGLALLLAYVTGLFIEIDPASSPEITARTDAVLSDLALAFASGAAGALAVTTGAPAALVGVMVAVALLPPTAAAGLLFGAGYPSAGVGALSLLFANVASVNLAATAVFLLQGVRPDTWWEDEKTRRATVRAVVIWTVMIAALVCSLVFDWGEGVRSSS
ncbi:MAG: TIGR00341 family protein [Phycisphaerae bacterium]|nr:TIGR00341 family protein [Phycisphaerae bacterium]